MLKISKVFVLLLLLENISTIQAVLEDTERKAIPIKLGTPVEFFRDKNYFTFEYHGLTEARLFFSFEGYKGDLYLTNPKGERSKVERDYYYGNGLMIYLMQEGTYYLEIICGYLEYHIGGTFNTLLIGGTMDTINLNQSVYINDRRFTIHDYFGYIEYKVSKLEKDIIVYFTNSTIYRQNYEDKISPYYPDVPTEKVNEYSLTSFEVLDLDSNATYRNVTLYHFNQNKEYIIRIHPYLYEYYWNGYRQYYNYYYNDYKLYTITSNSFKDINGNEGVFSVNGLFICTIPKGISKHFFLVTDLLDTIYYIRTNESIGIDSDNLMKLPTFDFETNKTLEIEKNENSNIIFMIKPPKFEYKKNVYIVDAIEFGCDNSYLIPANEAKLIYCEERSEYYGYYNHITTLTSDKKKLKVIFGEENEQTDNLIFNYQNIPTVAEKDNQKYTVTRNKYEPKFTLFGAVNPYLFKVFYEYAKLNYKVGSGVNIDNYITANQAYIRINSKYLPWFEFYNIYFDQFELKLNLYIKQIYGGSELYECETQKDRKDLTFLTTPITNTKCTNKKSIFNRLFTFDGTKILSGYITPDSYFDIYAEIEKENNKNIDIYSFTVNDIKLKIVPNI